MMNTHRCGLCNEVKKRITYVTPLRFGGVRNQEFHVCVRCDLTPEPPIVPDELRRAP